MAEEETRPTAGPWLHNSLADAEVQMTFIRAALHGTNEILRPKTLSETLAETHQQLGLIVTQSEENPHFSELPHLTQRLGRIASQLAAIAAAAARREIR